MAEKGKSIVDEALLEAQQISEAFETNAKEILTNTMGSEIEELVKESLEEDLDIDEMGDDEEEATDLEMSDELDLGDEDNEGELELDLDSEEGELDLDLDDEGEGELDLDLDGDEEGGLDLDLDGDELELDDEEDVEMIDLTGADDAEVINVFKKMGPNDEIQVVRDGNNIDIVDTSTDAEYRIELGGDEMEMAPMEESVIYEIEIDEEDDMNEYVTEDDMEDIDEEYSMEEMEDMDEMEENITRNHANGRRQRLRPDNYPKKFKRPGVRNESRRNRPTLNESQAPRISKLLKENTVLKNKSKVSETENQKLKSENKQLVEALKQLRGKLQEVAVFNSNLTYSVRLMTENATTKEEKVEIIQRMDDAKSLKESKTMYKTLVSELSKTKAPIKESIEEKINETKTSGAAEIKESKVYVNPEMEKMKHLMEFNYKY
jgi:hypothetical protein